MQAHRLDAVVLLASCDKIVPGMLMAAARIGVPAIMVVGGPMEGGCTFDERAADTTSLTEGLGMLTAGKIDEATYRALEDCATPTCGSCAFLGTANTMCSLAEALGMTLPGSANIPATYAARLRSAQEAGRQIVALLKAGITARDIITPHSLENALRLSAAIGGSTNVALHLPAIAYEAGTAMSMDRFEEICRTTPHLARSTTSRRGNPEHGFNLPALAAASGAVYVARWTTAQVRQTELSIAEALQKKGFSFVEIISPCPTYYGRMNRQPTGLDQMRYYRSFTVVRHGANPDSVGLGMTGQIVTGKFVDTERPCLPAPEDG